MLYLLNYSLVVSSKDGAIELKYNYAETLCQFTCDTCSVDGLQVWIDNSLMWKGFIVFSSPIEYTQTCHSMSCPASGKGKEISQKVALFATQLVTLRRLLTRELGGACHVIVDLICNTDKSFLRGKPTLLRGRARDTTP